MCNGRLHLLNRRKWDFFILTLVCSRVYMYIGQARCSKIFCLAYSKNMYVECRYIQIYIVILLITFPPSSLLPPPPPSSPHYPIQFTELDYLQTKLITGTFRYLSLVCIPLLPGTNGNRDTTESSINLARGRIEVQGLYLLTTD